MKHGTCLPAIAAWVAAAGCSASGVGRVTGTVTLDGEPLAGAEVRFWPKDEPDLGAATAVTRADGTFEVLRDPRPGAGLKPGRYVILVARYAGGRPQPEKDAAVAPAQEGIIPGTFNQLPARYNDRDRCPFTVEVGKGHNDFPLALERRPS